MTIKTEYSGMYKAAEGIIINQDNDALSAYKNKKNKDYQDKLEMQRLKNAVEETQKDIKEIKDLLRSLVK